MPGRTSAVVPVAFLIKQQILFENKTTSSGINLRREPNLKAIKKKYKNNNANLIRNSETNLKVLHYVVPGSSRSIHLPPPYIWRKALIFFEMEPVEQLEHGWFRAFF